MSARAVQWVIANSKAEGDDFTVLLYVAAEITDDDGSPVDTEKIARLLGIPSTHILSHMYRISHLGELGITDAEFGDVWVPAILSTAGAARRKREARRIATLSRVASLDGGWFCHYCGGEVHYVIPTYEGTEITPVELEHVVPRSVGGPDREGNYALSCRRCNAAKRARTPVEWLGRHCCDRHAREMV